MLIVLVSIFANWLFVKVAEIDINFINYIAEAITFFIVAQYFFIYFRKRQTQKAKRKYLERTFKHQNDINEAKNSFIRESCQSLKKEIGNLDKLVVDQRIQNKALDQGKERIKAMIEKFDILGSLNSGNLKVEKEDMDIAKVIAGIVREKEGEIKQKKFKC
jgi:predicted membrane protein